MARFSICDFRFAIGVESASFAAALASRARLSKQAGQVPAGPSPESLAPHRTHRFSANMKCSLSVYCSKSGARLQFIFALKRGSPFQRFNAFNASTPSFAEQGDQITQLFINFFCSSAVLRDFFAHHFSITLLQLLDRHFSGPFTHG